jgi:hypothetical protein
VPDADRLVRGEHEVSAGRAGELERGGSGALMVDRQVVRGGPVGQPVELTGAGLNEAVDGARDRRRDDEERPGVVAGVPVVGRVGADRDGDAAPTSSELAVMVVPVIAAPAIDPVADTAATPER